MTQEDTLAGSTLHLFPAEEYMEILQLRLDEDSPDDFFKAVFFLEDLVFLGSMSSWFV